MKKDVNALQKKSMGIKTSRRIGNVVIYILLIAISIIWLAPFVGIVLESSLYG